MREGEAWNRKKRVNLKIAVTDHMTDGSVSGARQLPRMERGSFPWKVSSEGELFSRNIQRNYAAFGFERVPLHFVARGMELFGDFYEQNDRYDSRIMS